MVEVTGVPIVYLIPGVSIQQVQSLILPRPYLSPYLTHEIRLTFLVTLAPSSRNRDASLEPVAGRFHREFRSTALVPRDSTKSPRGERNRTIVHGGARNSPTNCILRFNDPRSSHKGSRTPGTRLSNRILGSIYERIRDGGLISFPILSSLRVPSTRS